MITTFPSNPFATRFTRPDAVPFQWDRAGGGVDQLLSALQQHRAGLILGPHGSGKTTLLHTLRPHMSECFSEIRGLKFTQPRTRSIRVRCRHRRDAFLSGRRAIEQMKLGGALVLDGAEQVWRRDLRRLVSLANNRGQAVLATCHTPLGGIPILYRTGVSADLIWTLADRLLADADATVSKLVSDELRKRDLTTLTNVRDLWFEIYDAVQPHLLQVNTPTSRNASDGCPSVRGHDSIASADGKC